MHTLITDHWISRRKRTNHVLDESGQLLYTSADLLDCLQHLVEIGEDTVQIPTEGETVITLQIQVESNHPPRSALACPDDPD